MVIFLVLFQLSASLRLAQAGSQNVTELKMPARIGTVHAHGHIGGESHDRYAMVLDAGRTVTVSIAARKNRADFVVSKSAEFSEATPATFGKIAAKGNSWSGLVPDSATYYIYVTAHPAAHYRLAVTIK